MSYYCQHPSKLGDILIVAGDEHVLGLYFEGQKHYPKTMAHHIEDTKHPLIKRVRMQLDEYFAGKRRDFDLPLAPEGTDFQRRVWRTLVKVGCGKTSTYGELAQRVGSPAAARAVGAAVGRNPISVVIPCHRIVGSDGKLTGYAGGLDRKAALLTLERRA